MIGRYGTVWAHPRSRGENIARIGLAGGVRGSSPLTRGKPSGPLGSRGRSGLIPAHAGKTRGGGSQRIERWAHPRSRGENTPPLTPPVNRLGSSPLTRGKRSTHRRSHHQCGLIPAHAGKTIPARAGGGVQEAHPRSRGENATSGSSWGLGVGSSPLTRGKQALHRRDLRGARLIPAHAGKTGL